MRITTNRSPRAGAADRLHVRLAAVLLQAQRHESPALAELAALRRAAGRQAAEVPIAMGTVLGIIGPALRHDDGSPLSGEAAAAILDDTLLVASLVAFARPTVRPLFRKDDAGIEQRVFGSFGRDLATLRASLPKPAKADGDSVTDRLIRAILDAERDDLDPLLRRAFSLMGRRPEADRVAVHVAALVRDLGSWDAEDRRIQRAWAYDYWTTTGRGGAAADTTTSTGDDA